MKDWTLRLNPLSLIAAAAVAAGVGLAVSAQGQITSRPQAPPALAGTAAFDPVKFQQTQINALEAKLKAQQAQIDALKGAMDEQRAQRVPFGYSAAFGTKAVFLAESSDVAVTYYVPLHHH